MAISNNKLNDAVGRAASTGSSHLGGNTGAWNKTLPQFGADVTHKLRLTSAMFVAYLGLSGFGGAFPEKQAEAGIVTSLSADPQAQQFGSTFALENGGSLGNIATSRGTGSSVYLGNGWILTAGHVGSAGGSQNLGTGSNFSTAPGNVFSPSTTVFNSTVDLALSRYDGMVSFPYVAPTIASTRPANGVDVWLAGYGLTGTPAGYTTQDGFIRAGTSRVYFGPDLDSDGYSSVFHGRASFRPSTISDLRGAPGDSGGGVFTQTNELLGIIIAGSNPASGRTTYFVDLTNTDTRSWIDTTISTTAVPEPSSLALLSIISIAGAVRFRFKNKVRSVADCNLNTVGNPVNSRYE